MSHTVEAPHRILAFEGPLTIYTAAECKAQLLQLFPLAQPLEIDLSGVDELDTAGLQLLVMVKQESRRQGSSLVLGHPSAAVRDTLALSGLQGFFDESIAAFQPRG